MNLLLPGRQDPGLHFRFVFLTIGLTLLPAMLSLTGSILSGEPASWLISRELFYEFRFYFYYLALFFVCFTISTVNIVLSVLDYQKRTEFIIPIFAASVGFATILEFFHLAAVSGLISGINGDSISFFWIISRAFHCVVLIAGTIICLNLPTEVNTGADQKKTFIIFITFLAFITGGLLFYFYSGNKFPDLSLSNNFVKRPLELLVLIGYLYLLLFGTPRLTKRYPSPFTHSLFLSMIPAVLAEALMVFGADSVLDRNFIFNLLLKVVSYLLPFFGLSYTLYKVKFQQKILGTSGVSDTTYYLKLMNDISITTGKATSFHDAIMDTLSLFTNATKFDLGHYYGYNIEKLQLEPSGLWYVKQEATDKKITEATVASPLGVGEGVPGLVLESKKEVWITDFNSITKLPRRRFFETYGIATGFAVPVFVNGIVQGVLEFYSYQSLPEDQHLKQIAPHLGFSLGLVKELESAAKESSEQRFQLKVAQEMASIGSWSIELETNRMSWSDEFYLISEQRIENRVLHLDDFFSLIHEDDRQKVKDAIDEASKSTSTVKFECRIVTSTGKVKLLSAHAVVKLDDRKLPKMIYGTSQDITKRIIAERKYETLFMSAPDAIIMMNENGIVNGWNKMAENMFGFSVAEVMGKRLSNLIIPEEYKEAHERGLRRFVETGKGRIVGRELEISGQHKNGSKIPVNLKISQFRAGDSIVFIGFLRDISERKRSEVLLDSIMNSALQALMAFRIKSNGNGVSEYVLELSNQYAKVLFNSSNRFIVEGKRLDEIFSEEDLSVIVPRINNVVRTGSPERFTFFSNDLNKWFDIKSVKLESAFAIAAEDVTERKAIQKRFEENKHLLQQITDTVPSLLTVIDVKTLKPVYTNKALAAISGYGNIDLKDLPPGFLKKLIVEEDFDNVIQHIAQVSRGIDNEVYDFEFRLLTKSGDVRLIYTRTRIFTRDKDGSVRLILTIAEDVTSRKQAELELFDINKKFEAVFNQTFQLMAMIDIDGTVQKINKTALDFGMLLESEVLGKKFWEVEWWPHTEKYVESLKSVVLKAIAGEFVRTEILIGDESKLSYIDLSVKPMLNDEGEIMFVIAEGRDVTNEKRATERIRANEKLYRTMAENMPDSAVVLIDNSRTIQLIEGPSWNDDLFPKEQLIGAPLSTLLRDDLSVTYGKYYEQAFEGVPSEFDTEFNEHFYKVSIIPVFGVEDKVMAILAVYHDITPIKKYQRELEIRIADLDRSNKDLEQFAYIASHDLQEPLRKIRAFGDRLGSRYRDSLSGDGILYLDRMENAAERMQKMIDDLLTFSRVSRPKEAFAKVDLKDIVNDVLSDLEIKIESKKALMHIDPALPSVEAIPSQMRQLFQNLIGNALKFTREGVIPEISVKAEEVKSKELKTLFTEPFGTKYYKFSIEDNGIGFDEKYKDRIFTLFQRLHSKAEYEGTGIGLSVCKKIVEYHNGLITVHSVPGKGSTFIFYLPVNQKIQNDERNEQEKAG